MHSSTHAALSRCILVPSDHQTYFEKFRYQIGNSNFRLCRANKQVGISIVAPRPLTCCDNKSASHLLRLHRLHPASLSPLRNFSLPNLSPLPTLRPHADTDIQTHFLPCICPRRLLLHLMPLMPLCPCAHTYTHSHTGTHVHMHTNLHALCVCVCVCVCRACERQ